MAAVLNTVEASQIAACFRKSNRVVRAEGVRNSAKRYWTKNDIARLKGTQRAFDILSHGAVQIVRKEFLIGQCQ